jgi:hypothetical protein
MSQWRSESLVNQARCIAHYLHKNMRESYIAEKSEEKAKASANGNSGSHAAFLTKMGL